MKIIKYPSESDVNKAICDNEPLLALISFDGKTVITSQIDEAVEHHILLMKTGFKDTDKDGADWTFVCPPDYKNIQDKQRRIGQFYKDGFSIISDVLHDLGYMVGINIPRRYRRHLNMLKE